MNREQIESELDELTERSQADISSLEKQVAGLKKRRSDEVDRISRTHKQIKSLNETASTSLTGTQAESDKYRVALKKNQGELAASQSLLANIDTILPDTQKKLDSALSALGISVTSFFSDRIPDLEDRLSVLFEEALTESDEFYAVQAASCKKLGIPFKPKSFVIKVNRYKIAVSPSGVSLSVLPRANWPKVQP